MEIPPEAVLVDTRPRAAYEAGHLPGARHLDLSVPRLRLREEAELKALEAGLTDLFQELGLRSPVVLYDEGLTSRLCRTAFFLGLGGLEVELWTEGWEPYATEREEPKPERSDTLARLRRDWLLTADEAARHPLLLDVRSPEEYQGKVHPPCCPKGGRIPGSRNAPLELFLEPDKVLKQLGLEPGQEVGVYCHSGARSAVAFFVLRSLGVRARNYLGSMHEWLGEGLPTEP
ncbi:thiosulfate sulfurtransferase [Thermus scotoductus]|jgi:thiosulfate/3-mercaptopyruvate sulfurtransferase|uniref:Thiosulfate sulfurtransferase n=1 Tax=Thermus scotoductus TaxID=37636 RepID=A0A430RMJ1_THESC|nr:rhodanese-like domain-containing protein [Thermus scotoductus]RTH19282.1 thiosulfate sulfurtransferase [Thermus scotoductus]